MIESDVDNVRYCLDISFVVTILMHYFYSYYKPFGFLNFNINFNPLFGPICKYRQDGHILRISYTIEKIEI